MIERRYRVEFRTKQGSALLTYRSGLLVAASIDGEFTPQQLTWLWGWFPLEEEAASGYKNDAVRISLVPPDLSFDKFWNDYDYKVGKKERAARLWEALSDTDKALCLVAIRRYKNWLRMKSIEQTYPETFLAQRRFENEFKIF